MSALPTSSPRVLEPSERIAEVLFGLIMVLTFTGSLSVAEAGRDDVRAMPAMRASNAVAVAMLFVAGAAYGRIVGRPPWLIGLSMVALGSVLVALTMALGG